jgi:hypothetical protein
VQCETNTDQLMDLTMAVILNAPAVMLSLKLMGSQHALCNNTWSLMDNWGRASKTARSLSLPLAIGRVQDDDPDGSIYTINDPGGTTESVSARHHPEDLSPGGSGGYTLVVGTHNFSLSAKRTSPR